MAPFFDGFFFVVTGILILCLAASRNVSLLDNALDVATSNEKLIKSMFICDPEANVIDQSTGE